MLLNYYRHLVDKERLAKPSAARWYWVVRSYFTTNYVRLGPPPRQVTKQGPAYERGRLLTQDEVKAMVDAMDSYRDKAVIAFLAQTGQRIGILTAIKHSEIRHFGSRGLVEVPPTYSNQLGKNVNKSEVRYKFAIGEDTMRLLMEFPKKWAGDWIFGITDRQMGRMVDEAATKTGIQEEIETKLGRAWHLVHPNVFRKYWKHQMKLGGITDPDLLNFMMGHKLPYGAAYDAFPDEDVLKAYRKAERHLKLS